MRRSNPWPSFVDLFSALMLVGFGGLIMVSGKLRQDEAQMISVTKVQKGAAELMEKVGKELNEAKLGAEVIPWGEDRLIKMNVHFRTKEYEIYLPEEREALRTACMEVAKGLDSLGERKKYVQVVIEGHTDPRVVWGKTEKETFLGNWKLSSDRAAAVLYEFKTCGLKAPEYSIIAVGKADTDPDTSCRQETEDCYQKQRRTTLRLQVDTRRLQAESTK